MQGSGHLRRGKGCPLPTGELGLEGSFKDFLKLKIKCFGAFWDYLF